MATLGKMTEWWQKAGVTDERVKDEGAGLGLEGANS